MHAPGARLDGLLPVVVDKKPRPITATKRYRITNGRCHLCGRQILNPQLDGLDPLPQQAAQPLDRIDHRIEAEVVFGRREGAIRQAGAACLIKSEAAIEG